MSPVDAGLAPLSCNVVRGRVSQRNIRADLTGSTLHSHSAVFPTRDVLTRNDRAASQRAPFLL